MPSKKKQIASKNEQLSAKQMQFVHEYLIDMNATQACIRAGYSENGASQQGSRLLSNAKVARAVELAKSQRLERTKVDADWVLKELEIMARADYKDILLPDGKINPNMNEWPEHFRTGLIAGVKQTTRRMGKGEDIDETITLDVQRTPKLDVLKTMGNHMDVNAFKASLDVNLNVRLQQSSKEEIVEGIFEMIDAEVAGVSQ